MPRPPHSPCGQPVPLGRLHVGIEAPVVLVVLLGVDRAHEVILRSGETALVTSLYLGDPSSPLGMELRIWGIPGIRLTYLSPLDVLHVPCVSLRLSKSGIPFLSTTAPHCISPFRLDGARNMCSCANTEIADALREWTRERHAALRRVPLRPVSLRDDVRVCTSRIGEGRHCHARTMMREADAQVEKEKRRRIRGRIVDVRLKAPRNDTLNECLKIAVVQVCGACGGQGSCACVCVQRKMVLCATVRVEIQQVDKEDGEIVVVQCEGNDLARMLLSTPESILEDGGNKAATVLRALANDRGLFDFVIEDGGAVEDIPRLCFLQF